MRTCSETTPISNLKSSPFQTSEIANTSSFKKRMKIINVRHELSRSWAYRQVLVVFDHVVNVGRLQHPLAGCQTTQKLLTAHGLVHDEVRGVRIIRGRAQHCLPQAPQVLLTLLLLLHIYNLQ